MALTAIQLEGDVVRFREGEQGYVYTTARGRLYIGGCGNPVHHSPDGSFEISPNRTLDEVYAHAHLLGARVRPA